MRRADAEPTGQLDVERLLAENRRLAARVQQLEADAVRHAAGMVQATLVETLRAFARGMQQATGEATFKLLASALARAIGVDMVLIGERIEPLRIRSLAYFVDGIAQDPIEYGLPGTPCYQVIHRAVCTYPEGVQERFPEDEYLEILGVDGYMGLPLFDTSGEVVGLVAVLHREPLQDIPFTESMLQIVARAAEAELVRQRAEAETRRHAAELAAANERLQRYGERMEAEVEARTRELALEKLLMERILANVPAAIAFLDANLRFRWANPACRCFSGQDPDAYIGRTVYDVFPGLARPDPLLEGVLAEGGTRHVSALPWPGIGYVDVTYVPVYGADQQLEGILTFTQDVTARVDNERLQAAQIVRLEELDRLKGDFINAASHELRTPLTSIRGFAEFLEDCIGGPLTETQSGFVTQIQASAERLQRIVDDMLDFARLEAGTFRLEPREFDLGSRVCQEAESVRPQAREARLELAVDVPDEPVLVRMDPGRIGQVLLNLLSNAIKFTLPGGRIEVRLLSGERHVRLEVRDTGIGICPGDFERLFEKFFQVDASSTRERGGAGLGLAISRALVEAHGGTMGVTSQLNHGSTFWVELPRGES